MSQTSRRSAVFRYGLAVGLSAVALGLALVLNPMVTRLSPLFLFYAAVAISSWYGGRGPGLLATGLGAIVAGHFVLESALYDLWYHPADFARLLMFMLVGVLIAWLNGQLHLARDRWKAEAQAARRAEAEVTAHKEQLQELASQLMRAEEEERRRIAGVLHDSIGQALALAKRTIDVVHTSAVAETGGAVANGSAEKLARARDMIDDALRQTRSLTSEISPPVLYELGLVPALQWLGDRFHQQHGLNVTLTDDHRAKLVNDEVRLVLFQAVRELLFNAVKHARAHSCDVAVRVDGDETIEILVTDDGSGFDPAASGYANGRVGGFGLFNIRERISHVGGTITVESTPYAGTRVTLRAPLECRAAPEGAAV